MRSDPVRELQMRRRDVGYARMEVRAADRPHLRRRLASKRQDHREIVRRETPEDILLAADAAEIETTGIEVLNSAELAGPHKLAQFEEGWVELQQVADHHGTVRRGGDRGNSLTIRHGEGKRFLDEDMLAVAESLERHRGVPLRWRRERHGIDIGVFKNRCPLPSRCAVPGPELDRPLGLDVDHRGERAELRKVAHEIAAPMAAACDGHQRQDGSRASWRSPFQALTIRSRPAATCRVAFRVSTTRGTPATSAA